MKRLKNWLSALATILLIIVIYSVFFVDVWATARSWYYWWVGAPRSAAEVSLIEPDPQNPKHARLIRSLVLALDAGGLDTRATRVGIVVSPEINAATLGKDTFILSEGVADLPDRAIDAIMAHEVGHALKEHPKKAGRVGGITQLVARLVAFFFGASREGIEEYGKLAERVVLPQYSKPQELEADAVAVELLRDMGYGNTAPEILAEALSILQKQYGDLGGGFFDSHPAISARIEVLTGYGQESLTSMNEPNGFRGIKWGTPLSEFGEIVIREDDLRLEVPWVWGNKTNEDLNFAGVTVASINYSFMDDGLSAVTLMINSEEDFQKLKAFCFRTYGKQEMSSHDLTWKRTYDYPKYEKYRWEGATSIVELMYAPDYKGSYYGQLAYSSTSATRRLEELSRVHR